MKNVRWLAAPASLVIICFTVSVGAQVMPSMPGLPPASEADFKGINGAPAPGALAASQETDALAESGSSDATIAEEDALDGTPADLDGALVGRRGAQWLIVHVSKKR